MNRDAYTYIVGVDEVGRGSIAGPAAVGAVRLKISVLSSKEEWFKGLKDSKKLTAIAREKWFEKIKIAQKEGWLEYAVKFSSADSIDKKGIVPAIYSALVRAVRALGVNPLEARILLDGGLKAPQKYLHQETIIRGDEKEVAIALASIAAKVTRDNRMKMIARKHPNHHLHVHKGYGTRAHYEAIKQNGITKHHRKSFLKNVLN